MPQTRGPETSASQRARMRGLAKKISGIATSAQFLDAVEEVRQDPVKKGRLSANPKAYLRSKGVRIPRNVDVDVDFKEGASWLVCFYYYYWYYRIQYCYYVS